MVTVVWSFNSGIVPSGSCCATQLEGIRKAISRELKGTFGACKTMPCFRRVTQRGTSRTTSLCGAVHPWRSKSQAHLRGRRTSAASQPLASLSSGLPPWPYSRATRSRSFSAPTSRSASRSPPWCTGSRYSSSAGPVAGWGPDAPPVVVCRGLQWRFSSSLATMPRVIILVQERVSDHGCDNFS